MSAESRSPLRNRPLRNPGQSVEEHRFDLVLDRLIQPVLVAALLSGFAVMEVVRAVWSSPPQPWLAVSMAAVAIAWAGYRVATTLPRIRALKLAVEGEKAVGQYLERLRSEGYEVFHDVQGGSFNLDHVIVGPPGVFAMETKTWSKPSKGDARIRFDGQVLTAAGREPDRDPLIQARAQASWLAELVKESTGRTVAVRPVILFPGWFVEPMEGGSRDVWVLNPKALPEFLRHEPERLGREDVKLVAFHLSRFIRQSQHSRDE